MWRISFWSRGLVRAAVCLCPCRCVKGGEDVLGFVYLCLVSLVSVPHVKFTHPLSAWPLVFALGPRLAETLHVTQNCPHRGIPTQPAPRAGLLGYCRGSPGCQQPVGRQQAQTESCSGLCSAGCASRSRLSLPEAAPNFPPELPRYAGMREIGCACTQIFF